MMEIFKNKLGQLKLVAALEGIAFILLVFVGLPLKYFWGYQGVSSNMGLVHGLLFVLYVFYVVQAKIELDWPLKKTLFAIVLSFIPFGTFYVVAKMVPAFNANNPEK